MVNEAVGDLMDGIHALSITAKTPAENTASEQQ
jgi:stress-induced morphogen